jgi:drug/metabolite transporter (DMT)-like permease
VTATKPSSLAATKPGLTIGVLCGAGAALFWAAGFVAIPRGLAAGLSPADIAFHRFVWAGLVFLPLMFRDGMGDLGGVGWGRGLVVFVLAGPIQAIVSYSGSSSRRWPWRRIIPGPPPCSALFWRRWCSRNR